MNVGKPIDERLAVFIVAKNLSSIYPSDHHMVESPGVSMRDWRGIHPF
jgi:hypothetical protein